MTQLTTDSKTNIEILKELTYQIVGKGIIADLTITQGILEAGLLHSPPSELALKYNNLFGIKGHGTNGSISLLTHEYYGGSMHEVYQVFTANNSIEDSIKQHQTLFDLPRYQPLKTATTFEDAARIIKECGYATDPHYAAMLIDIWRQYVKT